MFELELTGTCRSGLWTSEAREATQLLLPCSFQQGHSYPTVHLECTWANSEPDPGLCPCDLCQLISQNTSRSGELTPCLGYTPRTANALQSGGRASPGARARINIWLTYGLWIFSSHSLGSCRGGLGEWNIWSVHTQPGGFGLNQIIIKTPVRKTRHNYFFPAFFPLPCIQS